MNISELREKSYTITVKESERISILKLWLCIMVVFIHSSTITESTYTDQTIIHTCPLWLDWASYIISKVISTCAVPWFFLLSGMFLYRKDFQWLNNIRRKVRTLLVPYLILNTFWIVVYYIAQHIPKVSIFFANPDRLVSKYNAIDFLDAYLGFQPKLRAGNFEPFLGVLWFVRDLFVLNLIATVVKRIIDRYPKSVLVVLIALLLFQIRIENVVFCLSTRGIVFFSLGYYCVKYRIHLLELDQIKTIPFILVFTAAILLTCCLRNSHLEYLGILMVIFIGGGLYSDLEHDGIAFT